MDQKRIEVGSGWLVVDRYGDPGRPGLVMLPGVMSDACSWRQVAGALERWPSVAVVNRRGRAPSSALPATYGLSTEADDLEAVLDELGEVHAVFGWSLGGLVALLSAAERPVRQVVAYEPVVPPFARSALPDLRKAAEDEDWDLTVEIVNRRIPRFDAARVAELRADARGWAHLRRLAMPAWRELDALDRVTLPRALAGCADRVDLIVGERSHGEDPYGTAFDQVRRLVADAHVHEIPGHGHLAHLEAPRRLAQLIDTLAGG